MTAWPAEPVIYEINTVVWLREMSRRYGRSVTLGDVPADAWHEVALPGVDAVWLMGVWERSPAGLRIALRDEALRASWRETLPDLRPEDVVGSPYCIRRYVADEAVGGPDGLAAARAALADRGVRLLLDYVPNHVAPDHSWLVEHPEYFVPGNAEDLARSPDAFLEVEGHVVARGRDPFFPPWPDVVQLNALSTALRSATAETLAAIGDVADGVRCDMAMLLLNEIFAGTWGDRVGAAPAEDFWAQVIAEVRRRHPDMLFVAEAYWDLEWALQQQGFDYCYDKCLYDRLTHEGPEAVRAHLLAGLDYQRRLVRFLENHDEPRVAASLPPDSHRAAAAMIASLPGATLWHEGQFDGRRVRLPVFLCRRPEESFDEDLRCFYLRLLAAVHAADLRGGSWQLLDCEGWPDNSSHRSLLAWCWTKDDRRHVMVVNFSAGPAQGRAPLPWAELRGRQWRLRELLAETAYERDGDELVDPGLFVALDGWRWHLVSLEPR